MKYGFAGVLFSALLSKPVCEYTARALPEIDIREFRRKHMR